MSKKVRGNIASDQIRAAHRLGDQAIFQMADGTFTEGNVPMYAADGSLIDSGVAPGAGGGGGGSAANWIYPIDEPPASPDSMDDEFNGSSLDAKWTKWNEQAGQSLTVTDGRIYFSTPYTIQKRAYGVYQSISGTSWKFRCKGCFDALTYQYFGMYLFARRTTSSDKTLAFGILCNSSDNFQTGWLWRLSGSDPSLSSESDRFNSVAAGEFYLEIEYDGTTLTWRYSKTGGVFTKCYHEAVASFLGGDPEYVGIALHPYSNSTGDDGWGGCGSFDWFRRIA